jgi:hypothetical protein
MTTAAQMKLAAQSFMSGHADYVFHRRSLLRLPVRHILVSFVFDRSSLPEEIRTKCGASVICCPPPWSRGGVGHTLDRASGFRDRPNFVAEYTDELERANREILERFQTLQDVLDYPPIPFPGKEMDPITRSTLFAALGQFDEATVLLAPWIFEERGWLKMDEDIIRKHYRKGSKSWKRKQAGHDKLAAQLANVERLHDLLVAGKPDPIATLLHEWEAIGVRTRGIERYWEPSPFPFELS